MEHYKKTITITATGKQVYTALTESIAAWWTTQFEGTSNQQGQSFTIRFGVNIFKTMLVEELTPCQKVVWRVSDAMIDLPTLKNKSEWIDTEIVWEIAEQHEASILQLTHFGLSPKIECYSICESGWETFTNSLKVYIETGKGKPYQQPL